MRESPAFRQAVELLRGGRGTQADALLEERARAITEASGSRSPAACEAQHELARLRLLTGDAAGALGPARAAADVLARTPADQGARFRYARHLAELCERLGELEEAENVLRQALGERASLYGVHDPRYAVGIEPLVALELGRGRADQAARLAEQALSVLLESGHPMAPRVLCLKAYAARDGEGFVGASLLSDDAFDSLVHDVLDRAEWSDARRALAVLDAFEPIVSSRCGPESEWLLHLAVATANRARDAGEPARAVETLRRLTATLDQKRDAFQALDAVLATALAASEAGDVAAAEAHYRDALGRAERLDPAQRSKAQRNLGLFLASCGRAREAHELLQQSLAEADRADDATLRGQALVALGIARQHAGEHEAAKSTLLDGLGLLAVTHPDALCGRRHLDALAGREPCGCG